MIDKVQRSLQRLGIEGRGVVVAVSGGPDSVALLLALLVLRSEPLLIAHVNHQLRGDESDEDERCVEQLARALVEQGHHHVNHRTVRLDIAGRAEGANLEATARAERYRWLAATAREAGLPVVVTGHTADDQAETVLHRLLRGSGLQGLRGIAERRPLAEGVELVRPMLDVKRAEVLTFLTERGVNARHDSSNDDLDYTRNRLRHRLLPLLAREFNPAIREVLTRLAEEAAEVFAEEEAAARRLLLEAELPRAGTMLVFRHEVLTGAARRRVRQAFRLAWEREGWPTSDMTRDHWKRLEAVVFDGLTAVDLPGKLHARRRGSVIQLGQESRGNY